MRLLIGGVGQGKLSYALEQLCCTADAVATDANGAFSARIWDGLEQWMREFSGTDVACLHEIQLVLEKNPNLWLICDEVGCGVVPLLPEERSWRERVGRICCALAQEATVVERIFCGLPMRLKG